MAIRVLLVDYHRLVREALRNALAKEPDMNVVGEAGDAASAFERADTLAPDVVVIDTELPDLNAIDAARRLRDRAGARIVALSGQTDRRFITAMLRAGAAGCVTKFAAGIELVRAIRAVATGQSYLCSIAMTSLASPAATAGSGPHVGCRFGCCVTPFWNASRLAAGGFGQGGQDAGSIWLQRELCTDVGASRLATDDRPAARHCTVERLGDGDWTVDHRVRQNRTCCHAAGAAM